MSPEERMNICKKCPLVKNDDIYGLICDSSKWMDPNTGQVSRTFHTGWIKGCGCHIAWKVKSPTSHCIAKKW